MTSSELKCGGAGKATLKQKKKRRKRKREGGRRGGRRGGAPRSSAEEGEDEEKVCAEGRVTKKPKGDSFVTRTLS